ncbi:MAG: protein adenylyltransferase SelO family protein, partial [Pseudomonadota bacterium]
MTDAFSSWTLEDDFRKLPQAFYADIGPQPAGGQSQLLHVSEQAAALLDLEQAHWSQAEFLKAMAGEGPVPGFEPLAMVYAGHQFGHYVPQLGDGRAVLIAQMQNQAGEHWDIQLKGAGRTPFSRFGDGRAVVRSSVREYLMSEAMAALGVPTTRALTLVGTGAEVQREVVEPGAIVSRLSPSFIRFGHFEYFHHRRQPALAQQLADHAIARHFEGLSYEEWFQEVVHRTADLMAHWQAIGFTHGVMNTDNMSILGLTIDYGPYGMLDTYDPHFIP